MSSQNVGRNGKRYKKRQRDRTKSDLKKYVFTVLVYFLKGSLSLPAVSHNKLCNQNSFSPYFINRSDMDYLLAHTRYTATQIQEFYRCQKKLRLSLLVLWFTILKILPIDFINISPTKSKLKWIPRSLSPWSSGP